MSPERDFDQDGVSSDQVLLKSDFDQDHLISCYFCFTMSHESNLIRCYYHDSDDQVVLVTDVTGLWQGVFLVILSLIIALHFKF